MSVQGNQAHASEPLKLVLAQFIEFLVLGGRISPLKSGTVTTGGRVVLCPNIFLFYIMLQLFFCQKNSHSSSSLIWDTRAEEILQWPSRSKWCSRKQVQNGSTKESKRTDKFPSCLTKHLVLLFLSCCMIDNSSFTVLKLLCFICQQVITAIQQVSFH